MKLGNGFGGTIYAGNTRINKNGMEVWTKKEDVTDNAIACVYQWFIDQNKKGNGKGWEISYEGLGKLTYTPEPTDEKLNEGV